MSFDCGLFSLPQGLDCSCQSGLSCRLTKQMIVDGKTVPVKQCMGDDEKINIETINVDPEEQNNAANAAYRVKRFLGIITVTGAQLRGVSTTPYEINDLPSDHCDTKELKPAASQGVRKHILGNKRKVDQHW